MITVILVTNVLNIEIAATRAEKENGLMYRRAWGGTDGMLFINKNPSYVSYWMKNTYLNLAMYFMDRDLDILEVYNPLPLSTNIIYSGSSDVEFVLELNPALTNILRDSYPVFKKKMLEKLGELSSKINPED
jgi:hypothetical protein